MKNTLVALCALSLLSICATAQTSPKKKSATSTTISPPTSDADVKMFTELFQEMGASIENHDMEALGKFMSPE